MLRHWLFPIISRFLHINGSHMKVAEGMREQISGALHNLIVYDDGSRQWSQSHKHEIMQRLPRNFCLTGCYLSLLATQHACAWDLISLIPNSAADSIRFSSNYSCQQQVLIIFTKPSYLHLFCRSIYYSRNERNILFIWKPRSLGTDLRDIPVQC